MTSDAPILRPLTLRRSISNTLKGSAGNLVEWYDVYVYSVFAVYFEKQFFPPEQTDSQLYVWAIFAVTFLMRPVGSVVFGRIADRYGRRRALTASITVMACCSLGVALIPTHDAIGVWAAVALVVFRLAQGMATGGEYGASATYMSEAAPAGRRGFFSSFQYVTLIGGHVLAQATLLIMVITLPASAIESWGWRVAFGLGGVAAIVVFWLRRTMDESLSTVAITAVRSGHRSSAGTLRELFRHNAKALILCFLVTMGGTLGFYAYTVNGPKIVQGGLGTSSVVDSTIVNLVALIGLMLLQPLGGWLSDRIGRKPLLVFFGAGGVAYTWFLYSALPGATDPVAAFAILFGGFVILTGYTSINAIVKAELFPSNVRALGVGFGYAIANSLFGGTAPLLFSAAKDAGQLTLFVGYVTVVIAASLLVYIFALKDRTAGFLDEPSRTEPEQALPTR